MIGKQTEERKWFTLEERKQLYKDNYGICACCGKKLTVKSMTIEHIIPLLRGGTNDFENLTILCYDCNQLKGNLLYLPNGFYSAMRNRPKYKQMQEHVVDWFQTIEGEFDKEHYPLISPKFYMQIDPTSGRLHKEIPFLRQMLLRWEYVNRSLYSEVEAVTGIDIRERKAAINRLWEMEDHTVALYLLKNPRTDKLLALAFLVYDIKKHTFIVDFAWFDLAKHFQGSVLKAFLLYALDVFENIFKEEITTYLVMTPYEDAIRVMFHPNASYFGHSYRTGTLSEEDDMTDIFYYTVDVKRRDIWDDAASIVRKQNQHSKVEVENAT